MSKRNFEKVSNDSTEINPNAVTIGKIEEDSQVTATDICAG